VRQLEQGGRGPWFSDEGSAFRHREDGTGCCGSRGGKENRGRDGELSEKGYCESWLGVGRNRVLEWVVRIRRVFPNFRLVTELGAIKESGL